METQPRKKRVRSEEEKSSEQVKRRLAKRVKLEKKVKQESERIKHERVAIKEDPRVLRDTAEEEQVYSTATYSSEDRDPINRPSTSDQEYWRIKVLERWSEDAIDRSLIDMPKNVKDWLATQPFFDPEDVAPPTINWKKYYCDRKNYEEDTRWWSTNSQVNPRIDLEQTYNSNRDGFASILVTHCYANPQDAADPEFLNFASFAKGFADAKLTNLHPFYRGSNQEVTTTVERVSKFLNIAAKFIFMNGGESVPRHPRLEYLGVSPFQLQIERMIEHTLDSFEPALFEFGRSAELPHYFWSNG